MKGKKRIVIIGATSAIAEHCARLWLNNGPVELTLVGRDDQRLQRVANDLRVREPNSEIRTVKAGFVDPDEINTTVVDIVRSYRVDLVLIAHGSLPDQMKCQDDLRACSDAIAVDAVSPVLYAEAFAREMARTDHGTIALIGSVAGDRGRRSNYVYGAAKGLVTRYAQGLQHRFAGTGVKVVLIKPGPTDTPMTAQFRDKGAKLAPVESVARQIVDGVAASKTTIYVPGKWRLIMLVIKHLPTTIFNKINI